MSKFLLRSLATVFESSAEAVSDIKSGSSLLIGGFGVCGVPENLLRALQKSDLKDLEIFTNLSGTNTYGPGMLVSEKMVKNFHTSYVGANEELVRQYLNGEIELELIPQGTLIEKFRAGSVGIPFFYTPAGANTIVETGGLILKYAYGGKKVEKYSVPKESKEWNGKKYLLEPSIRGDFAIIKAWKADTKGNLIYRKTARNSNADIAGAAKVTIAEVEEIVPAGMLDPDLIHTPGALVTRIVKGEYYDKPIGSLTLNTGDSVEIPGSPSQVEKKIRITKRAAKEIKSGMYVNLGIGMPTIIPNFIHPDTIIQIHGENGLLGIGPYPKAGFEDADLTNAGKETITMVPGASTFSSSTSFGIIRGSHLDLTILGGLQVSQEGDLANWIVPGKMVKGMGGAMDLASSQVKCIICMEHTSNGASKILPSCTLPLTGKKIVNKLITELAVFEFIDNQMVLQEIAEGVDLDYIKLSTKANYKVSSGLKIMEQ